ncbi:MAG: acetyl-CoA carboxylase carboxyltransferase subunit alpha [Candidatus Brocadiales bacterium]|nr:acetyl-CoA carboxylase carboxyltransferase subunit alpha [Candidatus Bathyanammoxibius amoris]
MKDTHQHVENWNRTSGAPAGGKRAFNPRSEMEPPGTQQDLPLPADLSPYDIVKLARHPLRPMTSDYLDLIFEDFIELHGDRHFGDDKAVIAGLTKLGRYRVMVIGQQKGKNTRERLLCNFGMPNPEGYRKALLKMKLAEKLHLPIITLIDTPGANPDIGAEERGQAYAIAENIYQMIGLKTPIINVVIGEGGSGGALGIGVGDKFAIMEYAYCSVISPEGCAAILWKDSSHAPAAANALKLTARELHKQEIVDHIIPEPHGGAHTSPREAADTLKKELIRYLDELIDTPIDTLLDKRYGRYRRMGHYFEQQPAD